MRQAVDSAPGLYSHLLARDNGMPPTMHTFASDSALEIETLPTHLARMDDAALARSGRAAAYMCSPRANMGRPPLGTFLAQLREARE